MALSQCVKSLLTENRAGPSSTCSTSHRNLSWTPPRSPLPHTHTDICGLVISEHLQWSRLQWGEKGEYWNIVDFPIHLLTLILSIAMMYRKCPQHAKKQPSAVKCLLPIGKKKTWKNEQYGVHSPLSFDESQRGLAWTGFWFWGGNKSPAHLMNVLTEGLLCVRILTRSGPRDEAVSLLAAMHCG